MWQCVANGSATFAELDAQVRERWWFYLKDYLYVLCAADEFFSILSLSLSLAMCMHLAIKLVYKYRQKWITFNRVVLYWYFSLSPSLICAMAFIHLGI